MGFVKSSFIALAVVAAILAGTIGYVGKMNKELFLKLPAPGFVLYAISGGNSGYVPAYFDNELFTPIEHFQMWVKPNDVIVAAGAKSGTTWMCYCSDAVRRRGDFGKVGLPYVDVMYTTPWLEMRQFPAQKWQDRLKGYQEQEVSYCRSSRQEALCASEGGIENKSLTAPLRMFWDHPDFSFRIFKSHLGPIPVEEDKATTATASTTPRSAESLYADVLPVRQVPSVRYVAVVRNPFEMFASWFSFVQAHREEFTAQWGGFPPQYADVDAAARDLLPGGNSYSLYFPYVRSWWPLRKDPNVLLMHYSDIARQGNVTSSDGKLTEPGLDLLVDRLSKFLLPAQAQLSRRERERVGTLCSAEHMMSPVNRDQFNYFLPLHPDPVWHSDWAVLKSGGITAKYRKEKAGEGAKRPRARGVAAGRKAGLSEAVIEQIRAVLEAEFPDPEMRKWALYGDSRGEA